MFATVLADVEACSITATWFAAWDAVPFACIKVEPSVTAKLASDWASNSFVAHILADTPKLVLLPTLNWFEVPTALLKVAVPAPEKVNAPGVVALMINIRVMVPAMFASVEPVGEKTVEAVV